MNLINIVRGWFGTRALPAPAAAPALAAPESTSSIPPPEWRELLLLGVTREDLLQILSENPFEPALREHSAKTLLELYAEELTMEELDLIVIHTVGMTVGEEAAKLVMERAVHKDQLGNVLLNVPSMRVEVARRTLAQNPETHDLMRCLDIEEVADEALQRLLSGNPERRTLLHILRYKRQFAPAVMAYLKERKLRVDLTPQMHGMLKLMRSGSTTH